MTDLLTLHDHYSLPALLAVNFDTIVFVVIVVVSLLARLFGKKEPEHAEEWIDGEQWDQTEAKQPQTGQLDWEEQMRRLLEGETVDQSKPAPEPVAAPVVPAPVSTPSVVPPPLTIVPQPAPQPFSVASAEPPPPSVPANSPFSHSAPATVKHKRRSAAAIAAVGMFRSPQSARQAILATVILGPPKGME